MTKTKKEAILKDKENLPQDPPENTGKPPQGPLAQLPEKLPGAPPEIKASGELKSLILVVINWWLNRKKMPLLQDDEKQMLGEALDKLEVKILEKLPLWLKQHIDDYGVWLGPLAEIGLALKVVVDRRKKPVEPKPSAPPAPEKSVDPVAPVVIPDKPKEETVTPVQ